MSGLSYELLMDLRARNSRIRLQRSVTFIAIALLAGTLAAFSAFNYLNRKVAALGESFTGMKCAVTSVSPRFPCGIKASDVTIYGTSGIPLFEAKEIHSQVNPLRYLQNNSIQYGDFFETLYGDQIKLTLTRNERGEWDFPRFTTSHGTRGSAHEGAAFPRHVFFTNVTIRIKTATGESISFYKSLEAEIDPAEHARSLKLSGDHESARITLTQGAAKRYHLQAENFSTSLLAPLSAFTLPLENILINGNFTAITNDETTYAIKGSGAVATQGLRAPVISSRTIDGFRLPFALKADLTPTGMKNLIAAISLAGETVFLQGSIRGWDTPVIDMTTEFQDFYYDRAINALPPSLRPSLPGIRLSGSMTGMFKMHLDMADPDSLEYGYTGRMDRLEVLDLGKEIDLHRLKSPFLHKVRIKPEQNVSILLSPENPNFTPYEKIPFSLKSAVMAAEDPRFFSHRGFSTRHIKGSLIDNLKAGKVVRGASTISMQLAKNLFLSPERTLSRKLEEVLITIALEQNLDKKRMMEIYLNIIEWGEGIYGIGPAARYYFDKNPSQLSPVESAFLASIIPRPKNWPPNPLSKVGQGRREYLQVLLNKMHSMGATSRGNQTYASNSGTRIDRPQPKQADRKHEVNPPSLTFPPLLTDAFPHASLPGNR